MTLIVIEIKGITDTIFLTDYILKNFECEIIEIDSINNNYHILIKVKSTFEYIENSIRDFCYWKKFSFKLEVLKNVNSLKKFLFNKNSHLSDKTKHPVKKSKKEDEISLFDIDKNVEQNEKINNDLSALDNDEKKNYKIEINKESDRNFLSGTGIDESGWFANQRVENKKTKNSSEELNTLDEKYLKMSVQQLRKYVRGIDSFPIKGREISRANKSTLLRFLNQIK